MNAQPIHPETDLPIYRQIERALSEEIANLGRGDPIPTEQELCERFGVSRMTVRAGIARLVEEGRLYRVRGRGTFVGRPQVHRKSGQLRSFSEDMRARGLKPSSRILNISQVIATPEVAHDLNLSEGSHVVLIERERSGDDITMALETVLLIPDCAAVLGDDLENGSLHAALAKLGHKPTVAKGSVTPESARSRDAEAFGIPRGTPLLVERRLIYDQDDTPLELTQTRYSPKHYVFDIELRASET
jgi:GntR family transcriptional regulator